MIALDDGRRRRHLTGPARTSRAARWLTATLVGLVLLGWSVTMYALVLVADGLSATNSHIDWWAHVAAVALIAVTIVPVWRWLRPTVDDVVYANLGDGYTAITELNRQIDVATPTGPSGVDSSLAAMIARTLNVPYVAIVDGDTETSVVGLRPADRDLADVPLTPPRARRSRAAAAAAGRAWAPTNAAAEATSAEAAAVRCPRRTTRLAAAAAATSTRS